MAELPENLDWKTLYDTTPAETMPWFYAPLDPDIEEFVLQEVPPGSSILDLGTGSGTQAIELAKLGYSVTGTDISEGAVRVARSRAQAERVKAVFLVDNVLDSTLPTSFDAVVDRGCFHVLPVDKRGVYLERIASLVRPKGWFVLKVFSPEETRSGGPHRIARADLERMFERSFSRIQIFDTVYQGTVEPAPKAYLLSGVRREGK